MSLTKREALVLTAWTNHLLVQEFSDFHKFAEDTLGKPIWSHEFASEPIWGELKEKIEDEFIEILRRVEDEQ